MHTRSRHLTRKRLIAPRRISPELLRNSHIYREAVGMVPHMVTVGTFREAVRTPAAVGMGRRPGARPAAMEEAAKAAGTTADDSGRERSARFRGSKGRTFDPRTLNVQPK
jgi:hypothetical protein